ncbi:hypothetical protein DL93DRAFT_1073614 [Clavulina sp. PMI_390]|nr:hypothetical protein DL93DRAFT_1073614 [Clavulina sp. PMI_390]
MPPKPRATRASTRARSTRTASGIQVTPIADPDSDVEMASVGVDEEFVDNTKDADDDDFDVEIPTASKGRKRKSSGTAQPKKPAKRSKRKGKLASLLTEMPSEVVLEICSSMHPSDLLNLSRSAKVFARFLLGSSVSGVWRAARLQIEGMPDCPEDMTEQKYAHFIFGNSCSVSSIGG